MAARSLGLCEGVCDLREGHVEYIVEQEGGALWRRQPLQREHEAHGDVGRPQSGNLELAAELPRRLPILYSALHSGERSPF